MSQTITDLFVSHLYEIAIAPISSNAVEQARLCLLDYNGVAMAGAKILTERENAFLERVKHQGGNVSVIGHFEKTTLQNAAFLNAMSAHTAELDDGHRQGQIHLGASIISALLPVVEVESLSEESLIRGIVVGYEAAIRMAMAMNPAHKLRGYHTSGTCGIIGVAMAIAAAMRFSYPQMKTALSAAAASAAGLLEMQEDESELKPYNLAHAAVGGIMAAYCALSGFRGPDDALGGKQGMLTVMTENPKLEYLTSFKEDYYQIEKIYRKPYAACRHGHSAIEAVLKLREAHHFEFSDITGIRIETYGMAIKGHNHKEIKGIQSAKMSIPFGVALALVNGSAGLKDYTEETIRNQFILNLASKVEMVEDGEISSWVPQKRAARVIIETSTGSYQFEVDYPKGEPENPMDKKEIENKCYNNVSE